MENIARYIIRAPFSRDPPALPDDLLPMLRELRSDGDKLVPASNTGRPWRAGVPNKNGYILFV